MRHGDREANPTIFNVSPDPIAVTASDLGFEIACDQADKQASILCQWTIEISGWGDGCWPIQCRSIAEQMTDEECQAVRLMLETLTDHLRAVPQERAATLQGTEP